MCVFKAGLARTLLVLGVEPDCCGEGGTKPEALILPTGICSNPHLHTWTLSWDRKYDIVDTSSWRKFSLQLVWPHDAFSFVLWSWISVLKSLRTPQYPEQSQPQNPTWLLCASTLVKAVVIYNLIALLSYLCLIKPVVYIVLSNFYLSKCCHTVCVCVSLGLAPQLNS